MKILALNNIDVVKFNDTFSEYKILRKDLLPYSIICYADSEGFLDYFLIWLDSRLKSRVVNSF